MIVCRCIGNDIQPIRISCQRFEQRRASAARSAEDEQHLARIHDAFEASQNASLRATGCTEACRGEPPHDGGQVVEDGFLLINGMLGTIDAQIGVGHAT